MASGTSPRLLALREGEAQQVKQHTYIVVVKQHDDLDPIPADEMEKFIKFLLTAGTFLEVQSLEPITLLPPPIQKEENDEQ